MMHFSLSGLKMWHQSYKTASCSCVEGYEVILSTLRGTKYKVHIYFVLGIQKIKNKIYEIRQFHGSVAEKKDPFMMNIIGSIAQ